jgi:hypothetical protein|tara:strand:- start:43306 stop:43437 length:132 start_codon:yes stop_codon:yes gene_type:complete
MVNLKYLIISMKKLTKPAQKMSESTEKSFFGRPQLDAEITMTY